MALSSSVSVHFTLLPLPLPPKCHHITWIFFAQRLSTPYGHTCHSHSHSGLWHAAPLFAQLHSVHFSPHINTGLHPAGLCGEISIIIPKHLSFSSRPSWGSAVALHVIVTVIFIAESMETHSEAGISSYCPRWFLVLKYKALLLLLYLTWWRPVRSTFLRFPVCRTWSCVALLVRPSTPSSNQFIQSYLPLNNWRRSTGWAGQTSHCQGVGTSVWHHNNSSFLGSWE